MVGLTHYVVRKAISEYLPPGYRSLWPTEMLSSRRIPYQREGQSPELNFSDRASGLNPQLLGNDEIMIRESIKKLVDWGAQSIDINMGCPVQKALKHNYGVALMGDRDYAARVVEMAVKHSPVPVSVKLRAGLQKDIKFLRAFAEGLVCAGASWITLHPRTAEEKRRGNADWTQIRQIKEGLGVPVIGNGDVQCLEDVLRIQKETHCDRVMVGRALLVRPWLMAQAETRQPMDAREEAATYGKFLRRVLELSEEHYAEDAGMRRMNFLVYHGCVWLEFGNFLYSQMRKSKSYREMRVALENFFSEERRLFQRTDLRH